MLPRLGKQFRSILDEGRVHFSRLANLRAPERAMSGDACSSKRLRDITYTDILQAQKEDPGKVVIIDVREQHEVDETGVLPGSIHIPMGEVANFLTNLSDDAFEEKFHRRKPGKETKIILSCRSGRRSKMVQEEICKLGYENALNYAGGWLDWESNQKTL